MKIVDAHHHLWNPVSDTHNIGYVWLKNIGAMKPFGDPTAIQRDYLCDEFRQESQRHELVGSVHIQADGAIADPVKESQWLEQVSAKSQLPSAHIGFLDLTEQNPDQQLLRYCQLPGFRGVRQILSRIDSRPDISFAPCHYLQDSAWRENFALIQENKLSFDLQLYPEQMSAAAEFFSQFPDVPIVIDHCGSPYDQTKKGFHFWDRQMALMAELPNCHIKISGLGMFDKHWSLRSVQALVETMVHSFGVSRTMFGSNYPVDKLMKPYDDIIEIIEQALYNTGLHNEQVYSIFADNAIRFYRL